jgi:glycosyltransferase 2 family protein
VTGPAPTRYTRWLPRLIGPALLGYFLWTSDLRRVVAFLATARWTPIVVSLALYPVFVVLKAWRWSLLVRSLDRRAPPLASMATLYMIGLFLGGATPGQSGDFLKAWYLRDRGHPLGSALFSILLDRLFDFLVMAWLTLFGLAAVLERFPSGDRALIRAATIGLAAAMALGLPALMARGPRDWLLRRAGRLLPGRIAAALDAARAQWSSLDLQPALVGRLLVATLGSAASSIVRLWLLFRALDLAIPLPALVAAVGLVAILQAVPISFSGLGVRDAVLIAVLAGYGYSTHQALALSALFLLLNLEHILIGFLVSLAHPPVRPAPDLPAPAEAMGGDRLTLENGR